MKGKEFEELAVSYLTSLGYRIVERNYHCQGGEIDIIAYDGKTLVFVEVKGGNSKAFGDPAERIDKRKLTRMLRCIDKYLSLHPAEDIRIDALIVRGEEMEHIKGIEI